MSDTQEEQRVFIPESATFETLNRILLAYLRAGGYEGPVSYRNAARVSGVHPSIVSLNDKFFVAAGFLIEEGRGSYKLTEKAVRYVQLLDWGKTEEAKEPLRKLLPEYSFIKTLLDYVTINKKVIRDELITKIITDLRLRRSARYTTGMNALLEMLTFSGLLVEEDETFSAVKFEEGLLKALEPTKPIVLPKAELEKQVIPVPTSIPVSISLMIDKDTDIEKLKAVIKAVKEALQEQGK